jgi:hypothetical protein
MSLRERIASLMGRVRPELAQLVHVTADIEAPGSVPGQDRRPRVPGHRRYAAIRS